MSDRGPLAAFDDKANFWQFEFLAYQRTFNAGLTGEHTAIAVSRQGNLSPPFSYSMVSLRLMPCASLSFSDFLTQSRYQAEAGTGC